MTTVTKEEIYQAALHQAAHSYALDYHGANQAFQKALGECKARFTTACQEAMANLTAAASQGEQKAA